MSDQSIEQELMNLETQYWQAMKTKDFEAGLSLNDFELKNPEVRSLGENVAVLAYKVREELTVDGKPVTVDALHSSTWIKRNGRWVCALHTESIAGDPFGRDRKAA